LKRQLNKAATQQSSNSSKQQLIEAVTHRTYINSTNSLNPQTCRFDEWAGTTHLLHKLIKNLSKYTVFHGKFESAIRIALSLLEKSY
jgi:hypothetical protein